MADRSIGEIIRELARREMCIAIGRDPKYWERGWSPDIEIRNGEVIVYNDPLASDWEHYHKYTFSTVKVNGNRDIRAGDLLEWDEFDGVRRHKGEYIRNPIFAGVRQMMREDELNQMKDGFTHFAEQAAQLTRDGLATEHPNVVAGYKKLREAAKRLKGKLWD